MSEIATKAEFYRLSRAFRLGNRLPQWDWSVFSYLYRHAPASLPKQVGVRHLSRSFSRSARSRLLPTAAAYAQGVADPNPSKLLFDEGAPHQDLTLQGEVMADEKGLYLRYSTLPVHQRELWERDRTSPIPLVKHARGLHASALLRQHMEDLAWETLNDILREYPGAVVEFATFRRPVGVLGWNTLFWEVRTQY